MTRPDVPSAHPDGGRPRARAARRAGLPSLPGYLRAAVPGGRRPAAPPPPPRQAEAASAAAARGEGAERAARCLSPPPGGGGDPIRPPRLGPWTACGRGMAAPTAASLRGARVRGGGGGAARGLEGRERGGPASHARAAVGGGWPRQAAVCERGDGSLFRRGGWGRAGAGREGSWEGAAAARG